MIHDAAIGSLDKRRIKTLMARGLAPEKAVDVFVRGILRERGAAHHFPVPIAEDAAVVMGSAGKGESPSSGP